MDRTADLHFHVYIVVSFSNLIGIYPGLLNDLHIYNGSYVSVLGVYEKCGCCAYFPDNLNYRYALIMIIVVFSHKIIDGLYRKSSEGRGCAF